MGGRRGRHGERTKQEAGGKSQEQTRGPVPRAMREGERQARNEKEARWKNVETASPTTILPMRTSEKKGKKNNNQCK